ncbi:hypothetical protein NQ315_002104, partial [Exocentrus adspersus]
MTGISGLCCRAEVISDRTIKWGAKTRRTKMEESNNKTDISKEESEINYNLRGGRVIATVEHGEEIVISGISGCFPNSNNIHEFRDNLFNKVNMVLPNRRWEMNHPEIPPWLGTIPDIEQYDTGFFGVHERQSHSMDPMLTMLQEKAIEAIFDAGLHPADLQNTKTGVYIGICFSENDRTWFFDNLTPNTYALTGSKRSMVAHRLSYFLKLKGPSYTTDTACSSSLYALEQAYRALRMGEIDTAIVGGTNICLHPFVMGVLCKDGSCKVFDEQGNGYARSEAVGVLVLQRSKHAKRIYSQIVHAKTNCDGYTEEGLLFPSKDAQKQLLIELYEECQIDRYSLSFLETHGTGTFVGDPEECSAIDDALTKGRTKPLIIGSVKSNMGHSEPASGICSIIKVIIGMETGLIPPNIHFNKPKTEIKGLVEGRLRVVTEKTPFEDDRGLVGISTFGFGGANSHLLLRWNPKTKVNNGLPKDNLPRLVCLSGRTEESVTSLLDSVTEKFDAEYIKLLHDGFRTNVENHLYRGYMIVSRLDEITRSKTILRNYFPNTSPTLYVAFGELYNWYNIGCELMALPTFSTFIQKIHKLCLKQNLNILETFSNKSNNNIGEVLGSVVVHLGLIELLRSMEVKPAHLLGYSYGALLSAYCDGLLSLEEIINCATTINKATSNLRLEANNNNDQETTTMKDGNITNAETMKSNETDYFSSFEILKNKKYSHLKDLLLQNLLKDLTTQKSEKDTTRVNSVINSILFNRVFNTETVAANSVLLQIGYSPREETEDVTAISLFSSKRYNPQISKLYPDIKLPVSRGTQMISPYIKWRHSKPKTIPRYNIEIATQANLSGRSVKIQIDDNEWKDDGFRAIQSCDKYAKKALIKWEDNWVTFLDNMLQLKILHTDTRLLYIPTFINRLTIAAKTHSKTVNSEILKGDKTPNLAVYYDAITDRI